jgi:hypothetical protein
MKKFTSSCLLFLAVLLLACGCSKTGGYAESAYSAAPVMAKSSSYDADMSRQESPAARAYNDEAGEAETFADVSQRKLVKRANLSLKVEDLEAADSSVSALMEKYGAYPSSTVTNENHRNYTIRVPSTVYDPFLAEAGGMGKTLHRSENTEDVSLRYYDLEGRLATKRELLKTFRDYLGRARNIEEILSVEVRIAELQNEIDGTGKELRYLAGLVDYSTVSLDILGPADSVPYRGPTFAERVRGLFGGFGRFLSMVAVVLIGLIIYVIPVLLILVLLFWLLFGKIGLLKKLYRIAAGKKTGEP